MGSSSTLYRLNSDTLAVDASMTLTAENRLLVGDIGGEFDDHFLSCDNNRCFLAEVTDFNNVRWLLQPSTPLIRDGVMNLRGLFSPAEGGTSELIYAETAVGQEQRRVVRGELRNVEFTQTMPPEDSQFSLLADRTENPIGDPIVYYTQFTHDGYIYFIHDPLQGENSIRVQRFCQNDSGVDPGNTFGSHFEIKLSCGTEDGLLSAAHFVTSAPFTEPTLIVSKSTLTAMDTVRVEVCTFSVAEINRRMWDKFRSCLMGVGRAGFSRGGQNDCTGRTGEDLMRTVSELVGTQYTTVVIYCFFSTAYVDMPVSRSSQARLGS